MIKDLQITMAAALATGEEWVVKYRELPSGILTNLLPNPTSNPIIIPALDDDNCYYYEVAKKCISGYLGAAFSGTVGDCGGVSPTCKSYTVSGIDGSGDANVTYNQCGTGIPTTESVADTLSIAFCAEEGSITSDIPVNIVDNGDCGILYQYALTEIDVCINTPHMLYSAVPYWAGVTMYTDPALTNSLYGFNFIKEATGSDIRVIDPVTGTVGALTGNSC